MEEILLSLQTSVLFQGQALEDIAAMLGCLGAERRSYGNQAQILQPGDRLEAVGLVLRGRVHVIQADFWGNRNLLTEAGPGQAFAESYACAGAPLGVGVEAAQACEILWVPVRRILAPCSSQCAFHGRLIRNLASALAQRNLTLSDKLNHLTKRTTRQKLLSYLSREAQRQGGPWFDLPFNRQQLADYLSVDRSALSAELSKLRREGILDYHKNHFCLQSSPAWSPVSQEPPE